LPHEKCGKEGCNKKGAHGRHYPGPYYYCECGFTSSTRRGLDKHLKQVEREVNQTEIILGKEA